MSQVVLDGTLRNKLNGLGQELAVCDEAGKVIGRFLPEEQYQKMLYALAEAQRPSLSPEQEEQRRKQSGGKALSKILKSLKRT